MYRRYESEINVPRAIRPIRPEYRDSYPGNRPRSPVPEVGRVENPFYSKFALKDSRRYASPVKIVNSPELPSKKRNKRRRGQKKAGFKNNDLSNRDANVLGDRLKPSDIRIENSDNEKMSSDSFTQVSPADPRQANDSNHPTDPRLRKTKSGNASPQILQSFSPVSKSVSPIKKGIPNV